MLVNGASTDKIVSPSVGARFQGFPAHRSRSREIRTNFAGSFKRAESVSRTRFCFARLKGPNLTPSLFYDLEMVTGAWANKPIDPSEAQKLLENGLFYSAGPNHRRKIQGNGGRVGSTCKKVAVRSAFAFSMLRRGANARPLVLAYKYPDVIYFPAPFSTPLFRSDRFLGALLLMCSTRLLLLGFHQTLSVSSSPASTRVRISSACFPSIFLDSGLPSLMEDSNGVSGGNSSYLASSEDEDSDADLIIHPTADVELMSSKERFETPDSSITVAAHRFATLRGRRKRRCVFLIRSSGTNYSSRKSSVVCYG
ncbi:hypothetical protein GW17_00001844 [Ensete ventricosum]|nr:hypothetical protein GW17_00001844 [Ensete ventricosum]